MTSNPTNPHRFFSVENELAVRRRYLQRASFGAVCVLATFFGQSCSDEKPEGVRVGVYAPPRTLNPRQSIDATGQQLGELLYLSLFRFDNKLQLTSDSVASSRWTSKGLELVLKENQSDHSGREITPQDWLRCVENYRTGKPSFRSLGSFPGWTGSHLKGERLTLLSQRPDPFFRNNLTLIRFFRGSSSSKACPPNPELPLTTSGAYRIKGGLHQLAPQDQLTLVPIKKKRSSLNLRFFVDSSLVVFHLLRGSLDVAFNALDPGKEEFLSQKEGFRLVHQPGVRVTYLAMNLRRPLIQNIAVRQAIGHTINREIFVRKKFNGRGHVAHSFLSPSLGGLSTGLEYDPAKAEKILDDAGFPRSKNGERFSLVYQTTPSVVGLERALIIAADLKKIGIHLELKTIERGLFFASLKTASYDLYSSRWVGVKDASIYHLTLHSKSPRNRVAYADPKMDRWLEKLVSASQGTADLTAQIEKKMLADLPYLPLWFWDNTLVHRDSVALPADYKISPDGALTSLMDLRTKGESTR